MLACKKYGKGKIFVPEGAESGKLSKAVWPLLRLEEYGRFSASYRYNACWMQIASCCGEVPEETQFLLFEKEGTYTLFYALAADRARASFFSEGGILYVKAETGDRSVCAAENPVAYYICGEDPYRLSAQAAEDICRLVGTGRLRSDKIVPSFCNRLGFCTYNSFGSDLSEEKIVGALQQFLKKGVRIGFLIFDEGWQNVKANRLVSFAPDPSKFPYGLAHAIRNIKQKCGVKEILLWHTFDGYWAGVEKEGFSAYGVEEKYFPEVEEGREKCFQMTVGESFFPDNLVGIACGVPMTGLFRFYFDWYSFLRREGADGTKVDAMGWMEAYSDGSGGRSALYRNMMASLEGAAVLNFDGEIINCSGCVNDIFYHSLKTSVLRTSSDYLVDDELSHGRHVFTNAVVSFWLNDWFVPDWDMFQSGNTAGEFHAIARAISGGPVYCTDNVDGIRPDILCRLQDAEGNVPRCAEAGRPARDCLFFDAKKDSVPFKIFNRSGNGFLLGAFHCSERAEQVCGFVKVADVYGVTRGVPYAVHSFTRGYLGVYGADEEIPVTLGRFEAELFRIQPLQDGKACFGLVDKYNAEGFVMRCGGNEAEVADDGILGYVEQENGRTVYRQCAVRKGKVKIGGGVGNEK